MADGWDDKSAPPRRRGLLPMVLTVVVLAVLAVAGVVGYAALSGRGGPEGPLTAPSLATGEPAPSPDRATTAEGTAAPASDGEARAGDGLEADDGPLVGPGTVCGEVETAVGPRPVRVDEGTITCAEAEAVLRTYYSLPPDPLGGNTAPHEFDGWRCLSPTAASAAASGVGTSCSKPGLRLVVPAGGGGAAQTSAAPRPAQGDLGLSVPMTRPACDGRGIVVLYSAVTPGAYAREISSALAQYPGASYLRTDAACPSLRQRDENGNVIYAVYRPSGYSKSELCADVRAAGGSAYGRWLDTTSDPNVLVTC